MRWEDERYVRSYTRDTLDWLALSFEAQGLFGLIMRKVDRAGIIRLGRHGSRGVAAIINQPHRWKVIEPALKELLEDGCVVIENGMLVLPNFIAAQETPTSDAQRQRDKRERDRDKALAASITAVTPEAHGGPSRPEVTPDGHAKVSRPGVTQEEPPVTQEDHAGDVTPNQPSDLEDLKDLSAGKAQPTTAPAPELPKSQPAGMVLELLAPPKGKPPDHALQVFEHWRRGCLRPERVKFDANRRGAVEKQLKAGRTVADLCLAADGCRKSPHHMGANQTGQRYDDLELICRKAENVEKFMALAEQSAAGAVRAPNTAAARVARERASATQQLLDDLVSPKSPPPPSPGESNAE